MFKGLVLKVWLILSAFIFSIFLLLMILFNFTLQSFFTNDVYERMEEEQTHFILSKDRQSFGKIQKRGQNEDMNIRHFMLGDSDPFAKKQPLDIVHDFKEEARVQKEEQHRYKLETDGKQLLYVISKHEEEVVVSFAWSSFSKSLARELSVKLLFVAAIVIILSIPLSVFLAKFLSTPLLKLQKHVENLADRKWDESYILNQKDEIGALTHSIEYLRKRLIHQDQQQQTQLQHVSHELKTPVMVIQSYVQAIKDEVFPKGDLMSSLDVINEESYRLEKKIKNLLLLSKLEYLSVEKQPEHPIVLHELLMTSLSKYQYIRNDVQWDISLSDTVIQGSEEQIQIVFENLFDNQLRYARSFISVKTRTENNILYVMVENDGEPLDSDTPDDVFRAFYKGKGGEFGLGLAIARQIMEQHRGSIHTHNTEAGVSFIMEFPIADPPRD